MTTVLFVCTGNIFRSVAAEYALKAHLGPDSGYLVGSAGIEAVPQPLHPVILARLREKGADPSRHAQRRLTRELVEASDLVVAMGLDHREFILRRFGRRAPLFNELCYGREEPILDVHEAVPDWEVNQEAARDYAFSVIESVWAAMPALLARLPRR
ncbi:MAG: hypothetical protein AB1411_09565 [Nitrospirota bacterium]